MLVRGYTTCTRTQECTSAGTCTLRSDLGVRHYNESRAVSYADMKPQRTLITTCWRHSEGSTDLTRVDYMYLLCKNLTSKTHGHSHSEIFLDVRHEVAMWTRQWRLASMQGLRQQSNLAASVGSRELALSIIIAERFVTHLAVQSQHTCNNTTALILYSYKQCKISEHIYIKLWSSTCIIHMYMYVILQYNLETEKCSGLTLEIYGIVVCGLRAACCCWNTPSTRHTRAQTDLENKITNCDYTLAIDDETLLKCFQKIKTELTSHSENCV